MHRPPPNPPLFPYTPLFRSKPITTVVIASDHGDHTAGNASFPAGVHYIIHPNSKAILDRSAEASAQRAGGPGGGRGEAQWRLDRKSTRLNSSHMSISYAVFC